MANDLFIRQNDEECLKCLVAQRHLSSMAKRWAYAPLFFIVVGLVLASWGNNIICSWLVVVVSLLGWLVSLIGEYRVDAYKTKAASLRQYVDFYIFQNVFAEEQMTKWIGLPLPSERSCETAEITMADIERAKVRDWYSDYSELESYAAVLECQKSNLRWDAQLRFILALTFLLVLLVICGMDLFRIWDVPVKKALPALTWGAGMLSFFAKAMVHLIVDLIHIHEIDERANDIERSLLENAGVSNRLVDLQNKIYEHRVRRYLVPDWIYWKTRNRTQNREDAIARERSREGDKQC